MGDKFEKHIQKVLMAEAASAVAYGEDKDTNDSINGPSDPLMQAAINWRTCAHKLHEQMEGRIKEEVEESQKRQNKFEKTKDRLVEEEEKTRLRMNEMVEEQEEIDEDYHKARICVEDLERARDARKK